MINEKLYRDFGIAGTIIGMMEILVSLTILDKLVVIIFVIGGLITCLISLGMWIYGTLYYKLQKIESKLGKILLNMY